MKSFNYTTVEGDRIDTLAARFYGGNYGIAIILDANPDVPITDIYPLGTVLIIPIVDDSIAEDKSDLPPWKQ
jgi:phage tail protein X